MGDTRPGSENTHGIVPDKRLVARLATLLTRDALPGETAGFTKADSLAAARLAAGAIIHRKPGIPKIVTETDKGSSGQRLMRLAIINDDMPFLVDSIAATVAAQGLDIHRVLHPIVSVEREDGALVTLKGKARESLIYLEIARPDASVRRALIDNIQTSLFHVRQAVRDWSAMLDALKKDAAQLSGEGSALLEWLIDRRFTLLGSLRVNAQGRRYDELGIARVIGDTLLSPASRTKALNWLEVHDGLMLVKANIIARVHRHAPLDLIIVRDGKTLHIHAGLWTSNALGAAPSEVPVLREHLAAIGKHYGFDPLSHAGKSLEHAFSVLPYDLLIGLAPSAVEEIALTAMSIADRPRPRIVLASGPLERHLYAFVWLPRDEMSTMRRESIAALIANANDATLLSWAIDLDDSAAALIRFTFDRRGSRRRPDAEALNVELGRMMRGWSAGVEAALAETMEAGRAARLAMRYANAFPAPYRLGAGENEAAMDILRLHRLTGPLARDVRLYRNIGDAPNRLRLKLYSLTPVTLSDAVPALENFGYRVIEEISTDLGDGLGHFHRFVLELPGGGAVTVLDKAAVVEPVIANVIGGIVENDRFNALLINGIAPGGVILFRALFRYLRQTGSVYGLTTVADTLARHDGVARAIVALFEASHDPAKQETGDAIVPATNRAIDRALAQVATSDDDRILRGLRAVVTAILRTNFFVPGAPEAIAFKFDSAHVPGLPAPCPWREIFVYSPRVEGIHLRAGPVARGGLRWSDRRDDFRTEILGLMKAQRVKNAVIVPTGAKGGFYPKALPNPTQDRDAWLAEGTACYRIFIRTLLSITDNIVGGKVEHPANVVIHDGEDPYFVVAADKGTATFSDIANAIAMERGFWLGDAFASGGSVGYDHKAMGITAKGAWISVQRHFAEMAVDVQHEPVRVVGCGDMSGDVFGNGMLLSKAIRLVAAFDHRDIFIDPDPDPATSWTERARLFALPRSSWMDYDARLISKGGGVFPRSAKSVKLSPQAGAALGIAGGPIEPSALISAILKSPADLIWFGGIGTYIKAAAEAHGAASDAANDAVRVNAEDLRAKVIGEGANLGVTQAARIAFSLHGGRINTDFIDNSAGVDCSDHEVNIKIALDANVRSGGLTMPKRNALLAKMTDEVGRLVLEDNRLQTLGLSIAERGGPAAIPSLIHLIETFEARGWLDRKVEGLPANDILARRAHDGHGMTRPEVAVLLSTSKLALQAAIEDANFSGDAELVPDLLHYFPNPMRRAGLVGSIATHRLRREIIATVIANRIINRLGIIHPFELAEEEGASLGDMAAAFVIAERLYGLDEMWQAIETVEMGENARLLLFEHVAIEVRAQMADLLRNAIAGRGIRETIATLRPPIAHLNRHAEKLIQGEVRAQSRAFAVRLSEAGAPKRLVERVVHLAEMDGAVGIAALAAAQSGDPHAIAQAFVSLGSALGLDWAQGAAMRLTPSDPWERLLVAGVARDFIQMRLAFLADVAHNPCDRVEQWTTAQAPRIVEFRGMIERARAVAHPSAAMLSQIAGQARVLLGRR